MSGAGGPIWGAASEDLNATLLAWPPGGGPPEHVNEERDVLLVVVAGTLELTVDDEARELSAGNALIVEKGRRRGLRAGADGVRYVSAHLRRPGLQIGPLGEARVR
jgi:quercetin dioxygenase-like cupin family protein